jgi:hypothetical protein
LTGCLVQGSTPSTFILENARTATDSATSKGKSYIITAVAGTDLKQHLNHQIRVTGSEASASSGSSSGSSMSGSSAPGAPGSRPDASAPASPGSSSSSGSPSGSSVSGSQSAAQSASRQDDDERDMTRFTARTVTMVASTCSAA